MRILLVQTSWLGDTILSTPVISAIRRVHPRAELWVMTTPAAAALLRHDPRLDGILSYDKRGAERGVAGLWKMRAKLREKRFDRVYSLHKSYRTSLLLWASRIPERIGFSEAGLSFLYHRTRTRNLAEHSVLRNLSLLSGEIGSGELDNRCRLYPPPLEQVSENLRGVLAGLGGYVVLAPGSAWETKRWSWEGYREVARHLRGSGRSVVVIGSASERRLAERVCEGLDVVNLAGMTDINEVMLVIHRSSLVVCNDSMALHMAGGLGVPAVAIFCSTTPSMGFGPWRSGGAVIQREGLDCRPCGPHGYRKCPNGTEACMREVSPLAVIEAVDRTLRSGQGAPEIHRAG